ncbi:MAG TPA: nucleotidyltransferase family protein [Candidatus Sulfotelmatobacter sp.]|nr:nucleotidyltransferase family protein [Candidatus Sulfotelmatobacter sp.]
MSAPPAEQIREILKAPIDWDYLHAEAAENSITPLVEKHLRVLGKDLVPPEELERWKQAARANTVRCLYLTAELNRVLGLFQSNGIEVIPYKGPVLAAQAYGDATLREFEDLDLILRQRDLPRAHEIMLGLGYRPKFPWILSSSAAASLVPGEYNYRDEARRLMVELHTEITLRHFPVVPDLDAFTQRLAKVTLAGREVKTFCLEDLLPVLCVHGSKDFWERLSWIADIAELVQANPGLDWAEVIRRAESLRTRRMLYLGLILAAEILDAPLPEELLRDARADKSAVSVASEVRGRLLSRLMPHLDAAGRFRFRRRMVPGTVGGWRYAARLAVVPAEEDWTMVRLPGPLAPLYVALRPLRLLIKYGWSSRRTPRLSP